MLVKRIDLGSIPVGLYVAGEDIVKGRAVVIKNGKVYHCSTKDEASKPYGFASLVIDTAEGGDIADHNVIKAGKPVTVYTIVKNDMFGTTEFVTGVAEGDSLAVAYAGADMGKLIKAGANVGVDDATPIAKAHELGKAGSFDLLDFELV